MIEKKNEDKKHFFDMVFGNETILRGKLFRRLRIPLLQKIADVTCLTRVELFIKISQVIDKVYSIWQASLYQT